MTKPNLISRRRALLGLGASTLAAVPLLNMLGCEPAGDDMNGLDDIGNDDAGTTGTDASTSADTGASADATQAQADAGSTLTGWATGGTAAMLAKASYPNPFASGSGSSCALTCEATIGPCHTTSPLRADVSNGWNGLPMRIALRVVDEACKPVQGALVEIWHTNYKGVYSGRINQMCNKDEVDRADDYFRGYLESDADGRVDFDSVFPGWYAGRAVHIHLRVLKGTYQAADNAEAWVVTQLLWDDALVKSIFGGEPLYADFGTPDTLLATDNVVGGESDSTRVVWDVQKMSDGAMLVSKTLVLRASLDEASCDLQGAAGGMMGGPMMGRP
jgi:protocatechuate 3,4-dioxygenase beta subunit